MSEIPPGATELPPPDSSEFDSHEGGKDLAIVSMILGLVGLISFLGAIPAIVVTVPAGIGVILGIVAVAKRRPGSGLAIAGIVTGGLGFSVGLTLVFIARNNVNIYPNRPVVALLQYKINKHAGEVISDKSDLLAIDVDSQLARGLKCVKWDDDRSSIVGRKLGRGVAAGDWVMMGDWEDESPRMSPIPPNEGAISIPIDPMYCPGKMLHLGDRVNVLGEVQIKPGQYKTVRLIDGLVVRSIGGKSISDFAPREDASSTYSEIWSSLPKDMVTQWYNLLTYVKGGRAIIELRNAGPMPEEAEFNPEVKDMVGKANPAHGNVAPSGGSTRPTAPPS